MLNNLVKNNKQKNNEKIQDKSNFKFKFNSLKTLFVNFYRTAKSSS